MTPGYATKVLLLGLDCVPPSLVFDRWRPELPVLDRLLADGSLYGALRSTDPPITVPAWMSMMTGRDPGELGLYGFRVRQDRASPNLAIARADQVHVPALWDMLGNHGLRTIAVGVPLTYPPRAISGIMVSGMLTPSRAADYTWPGDLKERLEPELGPFPFDVEGYRTLTPEALIEALHDQTRRRFAWAGRLMEREPWDLFVFVETGPDRLHHRFWRYMDPSHPRYDPAHPLAQAALDYYRALDRQLGELLARLPKGTWVLIVSDHGARPLKGGFCINEFLVQHGWLALKRYPSSPRPLKPEDIDWSKTRAWAEGGYYARIFLNVAGREARGIVHPRAFSQYRTRLVHLLERSGDAAGVPAGTRCLLPEAVYRETRGVPPDVMLYVGGLDYRAVGSVGHRAVRVPVNDTGPDDANHDPLGMVLFHPARGRDPENGARTGWMGERSILDIAPTVLDVLGVPVPRGMRGRALI